MVRAEGSAFKIVSSMVHAEGGKVARDAGGPYGFYGCFYRLPRP